MDHILKHPLDGTLVDEPGTSTGPWPRYLIMTSSDEGKTLNTLSPFAIHKGVNGIAGGDVTIKRQFNGDIYLTCSKKSQSDNLLKCVLFGNIAPVVVTPHRSLNSSKGVVRNWELARTDPDEIKENIPSIVDVQRIVVKRNNMEIKTNTLILTFNTQGFQFRAHRSARRLMCHGLGLSLLLGDSVLLLHLLAGHFHPSHDQWGLPLV